MAANPDLVKQLNVSPEDVEKINDIHEHLEYLIDNSASIGVFSQEIYNEIEELEFILQQCWGFPQDPNYHTWKLEYVQKVLNARYGE